MPFGVDFKLKVLPLKGIKLLINFKEHVKYIGEKASITQEALARIMPNIAGLGPFKRRIISAVVMSIMLYACPI